MPEPQPRPPDGEDVAGYAPSALPSRAARILAFASILVGGLTGGLIGWALVDLPADDGSGLLAALAGLAGAVIGAGGVAVVATLALRAMGEWRTIGHQRGESRDSSGA